MRSRDVRNTDRCEMYDTLSFFFNVVIDWVMRQLTETEQRGRQCSPFYMLYILGIAEERAVQYLTRNTRGG